MKYPILFFGFVLMGITVLAQDTTKKKEVNITSTFKPTLKEAAKINMNASPPTADTSKPKLQYTIPNQNLLFAFQPGTLKPLALQIDTGGRWTNESYIKLGFGNLSTPFGQVGLSIGDGKTVGLNVYARHVSSKGKIQYQDYTNTNFDVNAFVQTSKNLEWNARFGGEQNKHNKYGFEPKTLSFPEDSLAVKFTNWRGRVGFHNINRTEFGLSYAPEVKIDAINDQLSNSESNTYVNLPLEKSVNKNFGVRLAAEANLSRYKPEKKADVSNNFVSLSPSLLYKSPNISVQAGIKPSWDNSVFKLLPNVMVEFNSSDKRFAFQAGWIAHLRNSGFQYMADMNPWIWAPATVYNSKVEERYAGFKGSAGDHLSYSAKVAHNIVTNQPLFINDTLNGSGGKSFMVINDPEMKYSNFGGQIGYTVGERFSLISKVNFYSYKPQVADKAWGLLPLEFNTNMRIQVLKDLYVNADLYAFDGPWSLTKSGRSNLGGAMDLSAGLEFKIVSNIKLWAQFNNILNKEYQRWNQYPVYGFNLLGGVVFSFAQKN